METVLVVVLAVVAVGLCCLICYVIARSQKLGKKTEMRSLKEQRLLSEVLHLLPEELPYTIVHNHFMGSWLQVLDGQPKFRSFDVYKLKLNHMEVFGGHTQPWSRTYHNAIKIYGPGSAPKAIRAAIYAEHSALYRRTGVARSTSGALKSVQEFKSLIGNGLCGGEMIFFTYVLMENGEMRFSHTGVGALRDNLSKHAVHSNAAESVAYAGEFHFDHAKDILVLDNSSGTFAPDKEYLPNLVELFERNLPGMQVKALDWQDPELELAIRQSPSRRKEVATRNEAKKNQVDATLLGGEGEAGGGAGGDVASVLGSPLKSEVRGGGGGGGGGNGVPHSVNSFSTASPLSPLSTSAFTQPRPIEGPGNLNKPPVPPFNAPDDQSENMPVASKPPIAPPFLLREVEVNGDPKMQPLLGGR